MAICIIATYMELLESIVLGVPLDVQIGKIPVLIVRSNVDLISM
jgi:hypothetical protein